MLVFVKFRNIRLKNNDSFNALRRQRGKKKKKKTMMIISIVLFMKACFSRKDRSISKIMRRKKNRSNSRKALTNIKKRERKIKYDESHTQTTNDEKKKREE